MGTQIEVQCIPGALKCTPPGTSMIRFSLSALHFTLKCIALSLEVHLQCIALHMKYTDFAAYTSCASLEVPYAYIEAYW